MKIETLTILFISLIVCVFGKAQSSFAVEQVIITQPTADSLVALHIAYNQAFPAFPGYRIQLLMESGNDALKEADELVTKFSEKYPKTGTYITFREPYYRVRIGDFRSRLEAEYFLTQISRKYPNAWVIQDDIQLPSLSHHTNINDYE